MNDPPRFCSPPNAGGGAKKGPRNGSLFSSQRGSLILSRPESVEITLIHGVLISFTDKVVKMEGILMDSGIVESIVERIVGSIALTCKNFPPKRRFFLPKGGIYESCEVGGGDWVF